MIKKKGKRTFVVRIDDHERAEIESALVAIVVFLLENEKDAPQKITQLVDAAVQFVFEGDAKKSH